VTCRDCHNVVLCTLLSLPTARYPQDHRRRRRILFLINIHTRDAKHPADRPEADVNRFLFGVGGVGVGDVLDNAAPGEPASTPHAHAHAHGATQTVYTRAAGPHTNCHHTVALCYANKNDICNEERCRRRVTT